MRKFIVYKMNLNCADWVPNAEDFSGFPGKKIRHLYPESRPLLVDNDFKVFLSSLRTNVSRLDGFFQNTSLPVHVVGLPFNSSEGSEQKPDLKTTNNHQQKIENPQSPIRPTSCYRHGGKFADSYGMFCIISTLLVCIPLGGWGLIRIDRGNRWSGYLLLLFAIVLDAMACGSGAIGCLPWEWRECLHNSQTGNQYQRFHNPDTVPQKYFLTTYNYCGTLIGIGGTAMANILSKDKQIAIIGALAEGSSIRAIERMTGVHRDTIMRLGVRVGRGCASLLDAKMRDLSCQHLQFDEIWGFIGKKERRVQPNDDPTLGDVWTFCAVDADTKLVPAFKVGKRDSATANAFVSDVASRMKNRVQISSDALRAYVEAVELAFGANVDFAQIVKTYTHDESQSPERKYSAPKFVIEEKKPVMGRPDMDLASTSYIERLNGTTRLHMRRLTRLTYAFSKKQENFEAAVALHFTYYNFVKRHITLRCTPAMAAGVTRDFWTVGNLVDAAA